MNEEATTHFQDIAMSSDEDAETETHIQNVSVHSTVGMVHLHVNIAHILLTWHMNTDNIKFLA